MAVRDQLRLRIQDQPTPQTIRLEFRGVGSPRFFLDPAPVIRELSTIVTPRGEDAVEASLTIRDAALGEVEVTSPDLSAGDQIEFRWAAAIFTDEDLDGILEGEGLSPTGSDIPHDSLDSSVLQIVEILLMDAQRRGKWSAAGGQEVDQSKTFDNLSKMRDTLASKLSAATGGAESWPYYVS